MTKRYKSTKRYETLRQELSARAQFILSVDGVFTELHAGNYNSAFAKAKRLRYQRDTNKRRPKELLNTSIVRIYK